MTAEVTDREPLLRRVPVHWRVIPVVLLLLAAAAFFLFDVHRLLSFDEIVQHRHALRAWQQENQALAVVAFIGVYVSAVVLSVPGAIWLTIISGFLFGPVAGTTYAVLAGTVGASIVFLIARFVAGDLLRARAGGAVARMENGFRENALSYMLVLRLLPIFPFWLVNLVPALLGVRLQTYVLGTVVGVVPGSIVYTLLGSGLSAVIDSGGKPDLGVLFHPQILSALIGLSLLAMLPVAYRRLKAGRRAAETCERE
jgi:uncharacterized membrane protein YdjX (TVP38/TMEM64 family)